MAEKRRIQDPPIRIKRKSREAATRVANALGVSYIDVIEWATDALEAYYIHHGKRLLLPLKFHETFSVVTLPVHEPMILHEPSRVRSELVREEGEAKIRTPARKATARG